MEENLELIHRYIKGECDPVEKQGVEQRLREDGDFMAAYEAERAIIQGIGLAERERLKNELKSVSVKSEGPRINYWLAVAALIPLLILGYYFFNIQPDTNELYSNYYEPYGNYEFGIERGESDSLSTLQTIFKAYDNGDYSQVRIGLDSLILSDSRSSFVFYRGICNLELEKVDSAIRDFSKVMESTSDYKTIATWYLALAHLQNKDTERTEALLKKLIEANQMTKRAEELLNQLP
ncbi:MAG: hypothetical protein RJQ09_12050 [Cyclobacteriaceae bacterium]